ncbi:DUF523 domain-containing protein [Aminipila butyrica]|uniref:DUF523 domain-containing protein n=1 Tax=Aminipila butyrica TaxID=433296 RepID=A0A858BXD7_9FIRM|nr:DUF523 domain-containing protein [Aminipila butyrica]QIB70082.1 DUF523 domain-containing protein [Aminipila butyrica]
MYIISGCLLGENCKYNGGNNRTDWIVEFARAHPFISVCPELAGGLEAPRPPVEIVEGRAINQEGLDVTEAFLQGCKAVWADSCQRARELNEEIEGAILKAKSPSCGCGIIYDGSFSHREIPGDGFLTTFLKEKNIEVITELEMDRRKNK